MTAWAFVSNAPAASQAPVPEKPRLHLAAAGVGFPYLPFVIADSRGYFKQAGLDVEIGVFSGGAKALQALMGGSADIVAGAYSNTITMAAKGQKLVSFVTLASCPGWVFGTTRASHGKVKSYADLKGMRIGVSSPGSSFHMGVNYLLSKSGVKPGDVSIIGVGSSAGAIAAARSGQIDALMSNDPVATVLQDSGDLFPLAVMRDPAGTRATLGGDYPEAAIYTTQAFIDKNPDTVQAVTNAIVETERWMAHATPEQVAAAVPPQYALAEKDVFARAYANMQSCISRDGLMTDAAARTVHDVLTAFDPDLGHAPIDLKATYDNRFVENADKR
ncbi:ABC transporter substrate-binding protein [Caballeronia sp. LZ034LL]|uniref:ABC transporter substrate-binding protein n=1 Tax=Caballeronia sp. LZ034LL TaxID=3038567 RepID=UPI00285C3C48|nr:ABC transporter substrate-binding protein [Caballeronia sp. LZ034LL]MDR5833926.1 ABC transporter substrate-binding protein [Caballeronia sp. LZ034LL]